MQIVIASNSMKVEVLVRVHHQLQQDCQKELSDHFIKVCLFKTLLNHV